MRFLKTTVAALAIAAAAPAMAADIETSEPGRFDLQSYWLGTAMNAGGFVADDAAKADYAYNYLCNMVDTSTKFRIKATLPKAVAVVEDAIKGRGAKAEAKVTSETFTMDWYQITSSYLGEDTYSFEKEGFKLFSYDGISDLTIPATYGVTTSGEEAHHPQVRQKKLGCTGSGADSVLREIDVEPTANSKAVHSGIQVVFANKKDGRLEYFPVPMDEAEKIAMKLDGKTAPMHLVLKFQVMGSYGWRSSDEADKAGPTAAEAAAAYHIESQGIYNGVSLKSRPGQAPSVVAVITGYDVYVEINGAAEKIGTVDMLDGKTAEGLFEEIASSNGWKG